MKTENNWRQKMKFENLLFGLELLLLRIAARFGMMPIGYKNYHHANCNNLWCEEECPKRLYEETGEWRP